MQLVQIFVPVIWQDEPSRFKAEVGKVVQELTERFGRATSFIRDGAEGRWANDDGALEPDTVVIVEVQVGEVFVPWWSGFQERLERRFGQEEILVRYHEVNAL